MLCTSPVSWSSKRGDKTQSEEHLGSALPKFSIDPAKVASSTITNFRLSGIQGKHRGALGLEIKELQRVNAIEAGVSVELDGEYVRCPPFDCLPFSLCEKDALLYHDVDFALFHFNVRENVSKRLSAWLSRSGAAPTSNL